MDMSSFNDISLRETVLKDRSHPIDGSPLFRVYLQLSGFAPDRWGACFDTFWNRVVFYSMKRHTGVEGDALWIECVPEEVKSHHLAQLHRAVSETNKAYRTLLRQQAESNTAQHEKEVRDCKRLDSLGNS
jgi:hypothetical protein